MSRNTEMLGVKVKPDTKERISGLIEQAKEAEMIEFNGDIYDLFVQNFEKDELAKKMSYGADLREMQQITSRITDIFINLAQRNDNNLSILKEGHDGELQEILNDVTEIKEKRKELQDLIVQRNTEIDQLASLQQANNERVAELEKLNMSYTERIEEQKDLIDDRDDKIVIKNDLISSKEEEISQMQKDIAKNYALKIQIETLNKELQDLNAEIVSKNEEIIKQKDNLEFECQKRVFEKREELSREREKEINDLHEKHREEIERYQVKYEESLNEKAGLNESIFTLRTQLSEKDQYIANLESKFNGDE